MPGTELLRIQGQRKTSSLTLRSLNLPVVGRQKNKSDITVQLLSALIKVCIIVIVAQRRGI